MFYENLMTDTEKALQQEVRDYVRDQVPHELVLALDRDEIEYPREFVESLGAQNLLGLRFEPKWGGRGLPWTAEVIAEEEIGILGTTLGCAYVMPSIVGEALSVFGTELQKERYLKPLLKGEIISAEALTEPRGGSDFFGATCKAELKGDTFLVNGQKRFVVGATEADIFLVYCRTNFEEDAHKHNRISAVLIERGPGVKTEYQYGLMGTRGGGTGRLNFHNVEVPRANLIGELDGGAEVFNQMMIPERLTSAAACLGVRAALEIATRYSDKRKAFGQKIRRFQGVNFMVADAITQLDAARALVYMAAKAVDEDSPNRRRLVSEAKKFATDTAWQVANLAMQIMGGIGYTDIFPIERIVRDYRLSQIWTGTNEIMNLLIQHEYYAEVLAGNTRQRDSERDAISHAAEAEKVYSDEDQQGV